MFDIRAGAEPRVRLHRRSVGVAGSQRFGHPVPLPQRRDRPAGRRRLPIDLAANAASFGLEVIKAGTAAELADAVKAAKAADGPVVIYVETDPLVGRPGLRGVVGRAGQREVHAGVDLGRADDVRAAQADPETTTDTSRLALRPAQQACA
jgi:TPP-dependent trihydroxycyclohexane-1,2-dione (THcHDO) dehydratase